MKHVAIVSALVLAFGAASLEAQAKATTSHRAQRGTTVRVRMMQQGTTYKFEPTNFTIHPGDVVEFVNVSGFPHNVMFDATKIPAGALAVLNTNMPQRSGSLMGPMMSRANQTYRVSFANAPAGTYGYACLPHQALGMKGTITVAARH